MKRFAVSGAATLLFLLPGPSAFGQVTLNAWGGMNVSTIHRAPADGRTERTWNRYGYVPRPAIGVGLGLAIAGNWGIQLNVSDSRKGGKADDPDAKIIVRFNYLEISLLADLALDLGDGDRASLHLLAGPAVARMMSCQLFGEDCSNRGYSGWPVVAHDYGVVGGAELVFRLSDRLGATFGALYTYGLLDLYTIPGDYVRKNRNLTLRAGLQVPIGHR